jgi:hypothetical protein
MTVSSNETDQTEINRAIVLPVITADHDPPL